MKYSMIMAAVVFVATLPAFGHLFAGGYAAGY